MRRLTDRLQQLERGVTLSFQVLPDADGYLDKECPNPECLFVFKIHSDDWKNICRDEAVYCPLCRHEAPSDKWWTTEQIQTAKKRAFGHLKSEVLGHVDSVLEDMARDFNRSAPRGGFVSMRMDYRPGFRLITPLDPRLPPRDLFSLKIRCEACAARVAVIGSAFFCAACGHSGAERLFDEAIAKVRLKVEKAPQVAALLEEGGERDHGVVLGRSMVESGLADCVVAVQRLAEQLYKRFPNRPAPPMNAFQRIPDLDRLWTEATGEGLGNWLAPEELQRLKILYQRRHLLAHTDGIVDVTYVARSGDPAWRAGQRIVVSGVDVLELVRLVTVIAGGLRRTALPL